MRPGGQWAGQGVRGYGGKDDWRGERECVLGPEAAKQGQGGDRYDRHIWHNTWKGRQYSTVERGDPHAK